MKNMKNKILTFIVAAFIMLMGKSTLYSQYSLFAYEPPVSFTHVDLWHLNIMGPIDTNMVEFYVAVRVFGNENVLLVKSQSSNFSMTVSNLAVTPTNLGPLQPLIISYTLDGFYANIVNSGGTFPAGPYQIDYTLYGRPLDGSFSELAYYSLNINVENLFPPVLISVENNDTICEQYPIFTWTPAYQPSSSQILSYNFRMVEVNAFQTTYQAMNSNPYYYSQNDIPITMLNYPTSALALVFGQQYAWQIDAVINNQVMASSEIWSFVYGCPNDTIVDSIPEVAFYIKMKTDDYTGIFQMKNKILPIAYTEKYFKENNSQLKYRVYKYQTLEKVNTHNYELSVKEGINYYKINVCDDGMGLEDGIYIFEIIDNAGIKWYTLFEKNNIECN